jgi:molybdate transport system substrate-binding protein
MRAPSTSPQRAVAIAVATLAGSSLPACSKPDGARSHEPLRIAAAADLALAFKDIGEAFQRATGQAVELSFGSTGLLARQIAQGAPYDVFAAANVSFVDDVVRAEACSGDTKRLYAQGRLVMWAADKAHLPASVADLRSGRFVKIALANPEHAPYGLAAQQAMTRAGVWAEVKPRAVYGENVQQAMMFAQSGNAEVAIVALSLALHAGGAYVPIDAALHEPLDQALVVCNGGGARKKAREARAFVDFVTSEAGRAIMRKYGFLLPGEALPALASPAIPAPAAPAP